LSSEPYATRRIASLRLFMASHSYSVAEAWFLRERSEEPPALAAPGKAHVERRDCAGWWRRFAAWGIDAVVVSAIITSFGGSVAGGHRDDGVTVTPGNVDVSAPGVGSLQVEGKQHGQNPARRRWTWTNSLAATPAPGASPAPTPEATIGPLTFSDQGVGMNVMGSDVPLSFDGIAGFVGKAIARLGFFFWFPVYLAALVIVAGQTFGMMIAGLRVVTTDFAKPGIARTIFRYLVVFLLWWLIVPLSFVWRRILLHDRWSRTRLVKVERVVARITGPG
jgi:RDD family